MIKHVSRWLSRNKCDNHDDQLDESHEVDEITAELQWSVFPTEAQKWNQEERFGKFVFPINKQHEIKLPQLGKTNAGISPRSEELLLCQFACESLSEKKYKWTNAN